MSDRPIVVGADGSAPSITALRRAFDVARRLGVDVHVVVVSHLSPLLQAGMVAAMPPTVVNADLESELTTQIWEQVDPVIAADAADLSVTKITRRGYPADQLVEYADEVNAEMLVVGNRGQGPIRSAVLGSTSHRAAQMCERDVLIVRVDD